MADEGPTPVVKVELRRLTLGELVTADELLARAPLFEALGKDAALDLLGRSLARRYGAGEVVYREGTRGEALYVVLRGEIVLTRGLGTGGREVAGAAKGDFFGEGAGLDESSIRDDTATARSDAEVVEMPGAQVRDLARRCPRFGVLLAATRSARAAADGELSSFLDRW